METIRITKLLYEETLIDDEDLIKIILTNGEALIGYYITSDEKSLEIRREYCEEMIYFEDIEKIEVE